MSNRYPWFAKMNVKFYCDPTEPKLYPENFERFMPVAEAIEVLEVFEADSARPMLVEGVGYMCSAETHEQLIAVLNKLRSLK